MPQDRRLTTTERLRDAAFEELLAVGEASWTMDGIARRSGLSIGSVYTRWPSTVEALRDLRTSRIDPALADATVRPRPLPLPQALGNLDLPSGRAALQALVDLALTATTDPSLVPDAHDSVVRLADSFLLPDEPSADRSGMRWYVVSFCFGIALLRMAGCVVPPMGRSLGVQLLMPARDAKAAMRVPRNQVSIEELGVPLRPAAPTVPGDDTRARLIDAARQLVIERGARDAAVKDIAAQAGVTTGAIYRRYDSKADLLADIMAVQLAQFTDDWSVQFIASILTAADDRNQHPADLFVDIYSEILSNAPARRLHVAGMVAARLEPQVRELYVERITTATVARTATFTRLRDLGVFRPEVDPDLLAWLIQAPTVGARLLAELEFVPQREEMARVLRRLVDSVVSAPHPISDTSIGNDDVSPRTV